MDLAIRFGFAGGRSVLFVLVEHWSNADRLDLLRTARYYLDLCRRFPNDEIIERWTPAFAGVTKSTLEAREG